ncbi:MAG: hypothetical protein MR357_08365 [Anaeroplasma sp.]|nr:hypothetical protein [Anaeroplasma sp.]
MQNISYYIIIIFLLSVFIVSIIKKHNAYESFIIGAKDSMKTGVTILPYLLVMFVAVNVFRSCGIFEDIILSLKIPNELLIQGIFRPISSHASLSMMVSIIKEYGVDSKESFISTVLQGGSDTTVYVMSLYYGYIGIKHTRHSYYAGLLCDLLCFIMVVILYFIIQ